MANNLTIIQPPGLQYARYCHKAFPAYRFVPGLNPHPIEDPYGHSYGKANEELNIFNPKDWQGNKHYLYGVDLYNYAYWWESHEAWEGLWGVVPKNDIRSHFLQGLIQISAAFLKWHLREEKGVKALYQSAVEHLNFVMQEHLSFMGLDLKTHMVQLAHHLEKFNKGSVDEWPNPIQNYPFITLKAEL